MLSNGNWFKSSGSCSLNNEARGLTAFKVGNRVLNSSEIVRYVPVMLLLLCQA